MTFVLILAILLILYACWSAFKARVNGFKQQQRKSAIAAIRRTNAEMERPLIPSEPAQLPAGPVPSAHPDEDALVDAVIRAAASLEVLRPWLDHPELGQVAKVLKGAGLVEKGRAAEALDYFDEVLAEPPCAAAEVFFHRYPLPIPFRAAGIDTVIPLSRSVAAIYAAMIYQSREDSAQAMEAIEQADDSDLVTAMKASYAFNLDHFDEVLHITRWTPRPAETGLDAFALILRGCALREEGKYPEALEVINQAVTAAAGTPSVANRLNFEAGRTLAAQGRFVEARQKYVGVHRADPRFPGLEEALAELPA